MASGFVKKRGKRWYAIYSVADPATGRAKKKWEVAGDTRQSAQRLLRERLTAIDEGRYVATSKLTLAAFVERDWLPSLATTVKPATYLAYQSNLRLYILPHLGGTPLAKITGPALNALYRDLLEGGRIRRSGGAGAGLSATSVANVHVTLQSLLGDAVRWRVIPHNPAADADPPARGRPEVQTWTAAELGVFMDHCQTATTVANRYLTAWVLDMTTALRRGELLGLRWDAVDLDVPKVTITRTLVSLGGLMVDGTPKTKGGRRSLILDSRSAEMLRAWKRRRAEEKLQLGLGGSFDDEYVFCHPDGRYTVETVKRDDLTLRVVRPVEMPAGPYGAGPYHPTRFTTQFDRTVRLLDLPRITFHGLRHSYATLGLEAGEHPRLMADRLGHSSTRVTNDIYSHVTPRMDADLAERQARRIFGDR